MTLIIITYAIVYLVGFILAFILIGKCNRYGNNKDEIIQIEEALAWSLLSWVFILMIVLALGLVQVTESRIFKAFKSYFERGLK